MEINVPYMDALGYDAGFRNHKLRSFFRFAYCRYLQGHGSRRFPGKVKLGVGAELASYDGFWKNGKFEGEGVCPKGGGVKLVNFCWSFVRCDPLPMGSMYGIFTYIYHKFKPTVCEYTIHGSYGLEKSITSWV